MSRQQSFKIAAALAFFVAIGLPEACGFGFGAQSFAEARNARASDRDSGDVRMGVRDALTRRVSKGYTLPQLKAGIARFYDASSALWEDMWGEHMHHGYYEAGERPKSIAEHRVAQVRMVDKALEFAGVQTPKTGVDVGCGIGGSSRHVARQLGTVMTGVTLSPRQQQRATEISEAAGLGEKCSFNVMDALDMSFPADSFDLVWSMESGEHMPNKPAFVGELARVVAPGGRIIVVTWCHRDLDAGEAELLPREERLLARINKAFYLPRWCSGADYQGLFEEAGLVDVRREDWTERIREFWPAVIKSSLSIKGLLGLLKAGPETIRGALAMALMQRGYKRGTIKFVIITGMKPAAAGGATGGPAAEQGVAADGMPALAGR